MQDTNDFDSVWSDTEDQHVGAGRIFVVTSSNASKRPTLPRVRCQFLRSPLQFPLIKLGPLGSPPVNAIMQNLAQIGSRPRREPVSAHGAGWDWGSSSARNSSKSKGVQGPLCSPSIIALRKASIFASRSSKS